MQEIEGGLYGAATWPLLTLQTKEGEVLALAQQPQYQPRGSPQVEGSGHPGVLPEAAGGGAAGGGPACTGSQKG